MRLEGAFGNGAGSSQVGGVWLDDLVEKDTFNQRRLDSK